jgi:HK97 family phage prohead protease
MEKIFNLTSTFKSHTEDDGSIMIRGMASTADFDRAGDSISADAWTKGGLHNFEKNPIILFNHDYNRPIGRATGLKSTENGLELTAKISKSAGDVAELVKDGVLGAFSVGFRVKDADYLEETDGLRIKDAELFEVSVVSVPCNQSATFSLAKSFDSMDEYEDFKKTFTNSDGTQVQKEIKMSEETQQPVDLEAFAKKVAEETAAKIAMKQAEQKAADVAAQKDLEDQATANAEAKAQQEEEVKTAIVSGVESGTERLMEDIRKEMATDKVDAAETIEKYKKDLEEKQAEITAMQNSKRTFSDRSGPQELSKFGKELMYGHLLGVMTGKGWETSYSKDVMEKAGINYTGAGNAPDIAQEVSTQIEKEIMSELKLAQAFREITINSQTQVLPIQTDVLPATWGSNTVEGGNLTNRPQEDANQYNANQVILKAVRLVSTTFMDNNVDEEVLVNLMPMLVEGVARAHARAVDAAILNAVTGTEGFNGLEFLAGSNKVDVLNATSAADVVVTAAEFLAARKLMGKYGMNPSDLVYIVSQARYYDLIADVAFADITDVGSDIATKITGSVGAIYGTPVIVSDAVETEANTASVGYAVNVRNFVIPRLRGVSVEQDYEVLKQRNIIVASQSLGFNQLRANNGTTDVSVVALKQTNS